jgi:hypothetical protein
LGLPATIDNAKVVEKRYDLTDGGGLLPPGHVCLAHPSVMHYVLLLPVERQVVQQLRHALPRNSACLVCRLERDEVW